MALYRIWSGRTSLAASPWDDVAWSGAFISVPEMLTNITSLDTGDVVYVASDHADTFTTSQNWNFNTTVIADIQNPPVIRSVDRSDDSYLPMDGTGAGTAGGFLGHSSGSNIDLELRGSVITYGLHLQSGGHIVAEGTNIKIHQEHYDFIWTTTYTVDAFELTGPSGTAALAKYYDGTWRWTNSSASVTAQRLEHNSRGGEVHILNCKVETDATTKGTALIEIAGTSAYGTQIIIDGLDCSEMDTTEFHLFYDEANSVVSTFAARATNIKMPGATTQGWIEDSSLLWYGNAVVAQEDEFYYGAAKGEVFDSAQGTNHVYATGTVDGGTAFSFQVEARAGATEQSAFHFPLAQKYLAANGSLTLYVYEDNATVANQNQIWARAQFYNAGTPIVINSADVDATSAITTSGNIVTDTSGATNWTESGTPTNPQYYKIVLDSVTSAAGMCTVELFCGFSAARTFWIVPVFD